MIRLATTLLLAAALLAGCDIYIVDSTGGTTPVGLIQAAGVSPTTIVGTSTPTEFPTPQPVPATATPVDPASAPPTEAAAALPYEIAILGCDTGFDVTHGMLEVTNAYVTLRNATAADIPSACAILRAIDEEREHPDKERCIDVLPAGYEVTQKLTVDSTYKEQSAIQVDFTSNGTILLRVSQDACPDVHLFGGVPTSVGTIRPLTP